MTVATLYAGLKAKLAGDTGTVAGTVVFLNVMRMQAGLAKAAAPSARRLRGIRLCVNDHHHDLQGAPSFVLGYGVNLAGLNVMAMLKL